MENQSALIIGAGPGKALWHSCAIHEQHVTLAARNTEKIGTLAAAGADVRLAM